VEDCSKDLLLIDASPLISFLKISRFDLLEVFNKPLACTDFVRAEVNRPREEFNNVLACGRVLEIPLTDPLQLLEIEQLYEKGLGRGEASSIILAQQGGYDLILDDKKARKLASERSIRLYSTADLIIHNIQLGHLTLAEADSFITTWQTLGEYPVSCKTFQDLMPIR
jgi:predicted nucleic acid-binding protein